MAGDMNSVSVEGMTQAHGTFDDAHGQLASHLADMSGQREVLAGGWSGEASGAFLGNFDDWLSEMQNVHATLGNMRDTLATNLRVYSTTNDATIAAARAAGPGSSGAPGLNL
jgi:WXG100 family type VII secretion target